MSAYNLLSPDSTYEITLDNSPTSVVRIPRACILSPDRHGLPSSRGRTKDNNQNIFGGSRTNARATSVPRPRAVLSSPVYKEKKYMVYFSLKVLKICLQIMTNDNHEEQDESRSILRLEESKFMSKQTSYQVQKNFAITYCENFLHRKLSQ